jgi:hypothetical protein
VPQTLCHLDRRNLNIGPPANLVAALMQPLVMFAAQRYRVFVADFTAERSRLRELQMMRVTRCPLTDQARLRRDKGKVRLVSLAILHKGITRSSATSRVDEPSAAS